MKIEDSKLEGVLRVYNPNCRYLREAEVDFPKGKGVFRIPNPYYVDSTGHFNAVEMMICYNQLAYTMFARFGEEGKIPELGIIPFEKFLKWQLGNCFIVGMDKIKFRKPINSSGDFSGEIELHRVKRVGDLYIFKTTYDFDSGKAFGSVDLALVTDRK